MSKKGGRRFDQYINYRVGSMRMDSGVYLLSADRSALNLSGKIAQYERWIAGASAPSWAGRWQNVGDSDRVTVNMTLEDGTGSQFTMSLGAIRNSGGGTVFSRQSSALLLERIFAENPTERELLSGISRKQSVFASEFRIGNCTSNRIKGIKCPK